MKVLFLTGYMYEEGVYEKYNGGINIYVTQLAKSLAKKKSISVYALTYGKGKSNNIDGVKYISHTYYDLLKTYIGMAKKNIRLTPKKNSLKKLYHVVDYAYIDQCIKKEKPDIVHIHGVMTGMIQHIQCCKLYGIPVLVTLHGLLSSEGGNPKTLLSEIEKDFFEYADNERIAISVISSGIKKRASRIYNLKDNSNIQVIGNGLALNEKKYIKEDIYSKYGLSKGKPILVCIGRIYPLKNQVLVAKAVEKMGEKLKKEVQLVFVGKETDNGELRKVISGLTCANNIFMLGFLSHNEIMNILQESSLNIIASTNEGFGLTAIESMSVGVPTIMFSDLDAYEDLKDTEAIYPVYNRNLNDFANEIERALECSWDKTKIINKSKQFNIINIIDKYVAEYKRVQERSNI